MVVISNWNISKYGKDIIKENKDNPNLILIDAIYDIGVLNEIRENCYVYIHTHSYCEYCSISGRSYEFKRFLLFVLMYLLTEKLLTINLFILTQSNH